MKETTKLVLEGLEKINNWFNKEFEPLDLIDDGFGFVKIRNNPRWMFHLDFKTKDICIIHKVIKPENNYEIVNLEYRLVYTNFELEHFDEEVYTDFLQMSKNVLINWGYYKSQIINWYSKYKDCNEYNIKSIKNFQV